MEVEPRRTLCGRYQLQSELGHGGMGRVWRAHDTHLNRTVALKEILLGPGLGEQDRERLAARARREAQATAMGQHPNIVTVYDIIEDDGRPWIVMECLSGRSLHSLIERDGPHPAAEVASWGLDLLDALETAHEHGITHRDVKPENVMVTESGRVVLTDFGIATIDDSVALTQTAGVVGSPSYLAPERLAGDPATPAADLWALGATLFHARTGVSPFQRPSIPATLHAITSAEPPGLLGAGPLEDSVRGLLTKDPRYRLDAAGCRRSLRAAVRDPDATTVNPGGVAPTAHLSGAVPAPAPIPPTEHLTPAPPTTPIPTPAPAPTPVPAATTHPTPPGAYVPYPPGTPPGATPVGYGAAPPPGRGRGPSWPVVVLTLGLAAMLVTTGVLVFDPWGVSTTLTQGIQEEDGPVGGGEGADAAQDEEEAPAPAEEQEEPQEPEEDGEPSQAGMTWTEDPSGFSALVPDGWSRRDEGNSVYYDSPGEDAYLQVDSRPHLSDDEYQNVLTQDQEDTRSGRLPGYQLVRVEDVTGGTDFHSAADREFTWVQDGTDRRVLGRNITVSPGEYYTALWASDAHLWDDQASWRTAALESFDPP